MSINSYGLVATKINGLNREENFSLVITPTPLALPEYIAVPITIGDITFNYTANATEILNVRVDVSDVGISTEFNYAFAEGSTGELTLDQSGNVEAVLGDNNIVVLQGQGIIEVASNNAGSKIIKTDVIIEYPLRVMVSEPVSFGSGTLGEEVKAAADALVLGKSPGDATQEYFIVNNGDVVSPVVTMNPTSFISSLDLSAVSCIREDIMIKESVPYRYPMSLISDRHAIIADHTVYAGFIGSKVVFRRQDGTFQITTVAGYEPELIATDMGIVYLADAITGITPLKLLPFNWANDYSPAMYSSISTYGNAITSMPAIALRAWDNLGNVKSWSVVSAIQNKRPDSGYLDTEQPNWANLAPWWDAITGGDSGSPGFFIINNEPVLIFVYESFASQTDYADKIDYINSTMDALASAAPGTYTVTTVDLSMFTKFTP